MIVYFKSANHIDNLTSGPVGAEPAEITGYPSNSGELDSLVRGKWSHNWPDPSRIFPGPHHNRYIRFWAAVGPETFATVTYEITAYGILKVEEGTCSK